MWKTILRNILSKNSDRNPFSDLTNIRKEKSKVAKILKNNPTPLFVVDQTVLEKKIIALKKSIKGDWDSLQIAYSFKTNYELAKLEIFRKNNIWAEVVSGREYQMAKKLGYRGIEIVFNGPSKTYLELKIALNDRALVFVDNFEELELIQKIAKSEKKKFQIGLRLKTKLPRVDESRFGFSIDNEEASVAVEQIKMDSFLSLVAIHIHIGSDIDNPKMYKFAASAMADFIQNKIPNYESEIKYLDFGGGFPSQGLAPFGRLNWNPRPIESYVSTITIALDKIFNDKKPTLILEPGRYLVDEPVFFITKITGSKDTENVQVVTTDATITMLPLIQYRPQLLRLYDKDLIEKKSNIIKTNIYGASCRENDILYNNYFPKAKVGDIIIFFVTGAYNQNMASEFIFKKPKMYEL